MGREAMTLVDASSWIEFLRGRDSPSGQRVKALLIRGEAAWCEMTLVELWNGAQGIAEKKILEEMEEELRLYPVNEQVWTDARILARRCREKGVTAPATDIVIAACATNHKLSLEHCDSHFDQVLPIAARL
jgi:predicted nucleic acid-binding protein